MPKIHNMLSRGNWSAAIKRALGVQKEEGGIERFGETLTPSINLWDLDVPEWSYLRQDHLWSTIQLGVAAVAGEFSFAAVALPPDTNLLAIVEVVIARGGGASGNFLGSAARSVVAATGTQGTNAVNRDQRFQTNPLTVIRATTVETWTGSDPGNTLGGNIEEQTTTAVYEPFFSPPYIMKPGGAIYVIGQTVLSSVQVHFMGRVRQALPGELD